MKTNDRIELLSRLGCVLLDISNEKDWNSTSNGLPETLYSQFLATIDRVHIYNGWFTKTNVQKSLKGIAGWLTSYKLNNWVSEYPNIANNSSKTVGVIMAGNIPLVGFHDFISIFISGHKTMAKLSSEDQHLFPVVIEVMASFNPEIKHWVEITERLGGFEAIIATGSDNSATYFESYFGKYPNIIRKNRTSIAILNGNETDDELKQLGEDIFAYFGLGCRNVTQILIPEDFVLDRFFEAIYDFNLIVNHNKYANNYDYNKAVYLLNLEPILDNNFILLKEDESLHSPLGVLFYKRYKNKADVESFITENQHKIQAVIGQDYINFGGSQAPSLLDYADDVDTLEFLTKL